MCDLACGIELIKDIILSFEHIVGHTCDSVACTFFCIISLSYMVTSIEQFLTFNMGTTKACGMAQ